MDDLSLSNWHSNNHEKARKQRVLKFAITREKMAELIERNESGESISDIARSEGVKYKTLRNAMIDAKINGFLSTRVI